MPPIKWTVAISLLLMLIGVSVAGLAADNSPPNWAGIAFGAVLTLAGVGVAVLSQHER